MTQELIWVTRTAPFNRLTAKRLAGAGHDALCAPVLRVVPIPAPPLMAVPDALVFTSLNGVRLHRFSPSLAEVAVFAVGDHSARYARAREYFDVVTGLWDTLQPTAAGYTTITAGDGQTYLVSRITIDSSPILFT